MTRKLYGIIPYVLLEKPLIAAGVPFESHYDGPRAIQQEFDIERFKELNRAFIDELGHHSTISTWFLIEVDDSATRASVDLAYSRLLAAAQFALLDSGGYRDQPDSERVDAYLFELVHKLPAPEEGYLWRTHSPFRRQMYLWPLKDALFPRAPNVRFDFLHGHLRASEILQRLVPPDASFLDLAQPDNKLLDSLSFFVQSCSSAELTDIRARILLLATAFEVLFDLSTAKTGKAAKLVNAVSECLGATFSQWKPRDINRQMKDLRKFSQDFYKLRSDIAHEGETDPEEFLFRAKGAKGGFVGFLWKARQLYVECVRAKLGILENVELALILADLVHNEDRLRRIRSGLETKNPDRVHEALALCSELQQYPSGERFEDILGAWRALVEFYRGELEPRGKALPADIRQSLQEGAPSRLWNLFLRISESLRPRLPIVVDDYSMFVTEHAMSQFADYAHYAALLRSSAPAEQPPQDV